MIPSFPAGGELLLNLAVAGIIVAVFGIAVVVQRDNRRLLVGNVAGDHAGVLFFVEALFAPESIVLTLAAGGFGITMLTTHGLGWRDRLPSGDDATAD